MPRSEALAFERDDAFSIAVDGVPRVHGTIERHARGFTLRPSKPDWAVARSVGVSFARQAALHIVTTTIGAP